MGMAHKADLRAMEAEGEQRSGSDSDADKHRKGSRLHENHRDENRPMFVQESDNFDHDLRPNNLAGENHGLQGQTPVGYGQPAIEIKSLHTQLADLTHDELRTWKSCRKAPVWSKVPPTSICAIPTRTSS